MCRDYVNVHRRYIYKINNMCAYVVTTRYIVFTMCIDIDPVKNILTGDIYIDRLYFVKYIC